MDQKIRTHISKVNINECTYHNEDFEPTLINFLLGKNGSGKTTVARVIRDKKGLSWAPGCDPNTMLMVYNEDYIRDNIQSYGNIPGVFTMSKANAELKKQADEKTKAKNAFADSLKKAEETAASLRNTEAGLEEKYGQFTWEKTQDWRKTNFTQIPFPGKKVKLFTDLYEIYKKHPETETFDELWEAYQKIFTKEPPKYEPYVNVNINCLPNSDLLLEPIYSSADTIFASFVRTLGNLDWVRFGHENYLHGANGKCPFCQQRMPENFEADLASCFDEEYRKKVEMLQAFVKQYKDALNRVYVLLRDNQKNPFPLDELRSHDYQYEFDMFMEKARANVAFLEEKANNPSTRLYQFEDLSPYLSKIATVIGLINHDIAEYMQKATDPKEKIALAKRISNFIAMECSEFFAKYEMEKESVQGAKEQSEKQVESLKTQIKTLTAEIADLNKSTVNTTKTMEDINATLQAIGFRGFYLREKQGASYVYELVRERNGEITIAKGLSEGERNFIAFLYFYHTVMGSQSDDGRIDDKIVVIDDPVSSMDENTFFYVSALIREMIAVCYNNYDMDEKRGSDEHIRQIFCLTHNPVLFRDISSNWLAEYECASFFEIIKDKDNHSHIKLLIDNEDTAGGRKVNVSPVKNYYDSLWHEFRRTESSEMALSLSRQILEFFFIQTEGFKPSSLCDELFEGERKYEFQRTLESGEIDKTYINIARAMVSLLDVGVTNFNDRLFFNAMSYSPDQMREAFAIIFDVMKREQHYNRMMGKKN